MSSIRLGAPVRAGWFVSDELIVIHFMLIAVYRFETESVSTGSP